MKNKVKKLLDKMAPEIANITNKSIDLEEFLSYKKPISNDRGVSLVISKTSKPVESKVNPLIMQMIKEEDEKSAKVLDKYSKFKSPLSFVPMSKGETIFRAKILEIEPEEYTYILDHGIDPMAFVDEEGFSAQELINALKSKDKK